MVQNVIVLPEKQISRKFFSLKKTLFLIIILFGVGIGFIFWKKTTTQNTISVDSLSDRSKEFLAEQAKQGDIVWNQVNLATSSATSDVVDHPEFKTACLSVKVPFEVIRIKQAENDQGYLCRLEMQVLSPRSNLVITAKKADKTSEDAGITLRKQQPDIYKKVELPVTSIKNYQAFEAEDSLSIFFQAKGLNIVVAFSEAAQLDLLQLDTVAELIDSMVIRD